MGDLAHFWKGYALSTIEDDSINNAHLSVSGNAQPGTSPHPNAPVVSIYCDGTQQLVANSGTIEMNDHARTVEFWSDFNDSSGQKIYRELQGSNELFAVEVDVTSNTGTAEVRYATPDVSYNQVVGNQNFEPTTTTPLGYGDPTSLAYVANNYFVTETEGTGPDNPNFRPSELYWNGSSFDKYEEVAGPFSGPETLALNSHPHTLQYRTYFNPFDDNNVLVCYTAIRDRSQGSNVVGGEVVWFGRMTTNNQPGGLASVDTSWNKIHEAPNFNSATSTFATIRICIVHEFFLDSSGTPWVLLGEYSNGGTNQQKYDNEVAYSPKMYIAEVQKDGSGNYIVGTKQTLTLPQYGLGSTGTLAGRMNSIKYTSSGHLWIKHETNRQSVSPWNNSKAVSVFESQGGTWTLVDYISDPNTTNQLDRAGTDAVWNLTYNTLGGHLHRIVGGVIQTNNYEFSSDFISGGMLTQAAYNSRFDSFAVAEVLNGQTYLVSTVWTYDDQFFLAAVPFDEVAGTVDVANAIEFLRGQPGDGYGNFSYYTSDIMVGTISGSPALLYGWSGDVQGADFDGISYILNAEIPVVATVTVDLGSQGTGFSHTMITVDPGSSVTAYRDGKLSATADSPSYMKSGTPTSLEVAYGVSGYLGELAVWNNVLDPSQARMRSALSGDAVETEVDVLELGVITATSEAYEST